MNLDIIQVKNSLEYGRCRCGELTNFRFADLTSRCHVLCCSIDCAQKAIEYKLSKPQYFGNEYRPMPEPKI